MIEAALLFALGDAQAQSPNPHLLPAAQEQAEIAAAVADERDGRSRWFVRTGVAGVLYNSDAIIAAGGVIVPGATAKVTDNVTPMLDIGYNVSDSFAVVAMVGIPPRPEAIGRGTLSPVGKLGAVRLGPVVATVIYRLPEFRGFRAYVGAGGTYAFILRNHDGAVTDLDVSDNWGVALQGGLEYRVNRRLELFVDYKRLWLDLKAEGMLGPAPVRARVTLDPDVISAGLKLNFR